jgi:hypothetical protein
MYKFSALQTILLKSPVKSQNLQISGNMTNFDLSHIDMIIFNLFITSMIMFANIS